MAKITNGIILDGIIYEAVPREGRKCDGCDIEERCNGSCGICYDLFRSREYVFRLHQPMTDNNNETREHRTC